MHIFQLDLEEEDFEEINNLINTRRVKTVYSVTGHEGVDSITVKGIEPDRVVTLLSGEMNLREERRDGYINISNSEAYGHLTINAGLWILNKVKILAVITISISNIINRCVISERLRGTERIYQLIDETRE